MSVIFGLIVVAGLTASPESGSALRYVALAALVIALVTLSVQGVREWQAERDGRDELKLP